MIPVKIAIIEARKQERIDPLLEEIKRLDSFQKNLT
jgi:hypothetical protein